MTSTDRIHEVGLQTVRILVFVHQNVLESLPVILPELPTFLQ